MASSHFSLHSFLYHHFRLYEGEDDKWYVDWDMLEARLREGGVRCKVPLLLTTSSSVSNYSGIVLNTPHNPTGKVFEKEELAKIAELAVK